MTLLSRLHRLVQVILLTSCMLLTACGSDDDDDDGGGSNTTPPPAGTVNGTSIKGIITGGAIEVREVLSDGTLSDVLATATTNSSGEYVAEVSADYTGGALKITLTAVSGTTMKCDAPSGCGDDSFGDDVPLMPGFSLSAFVTELGGDSLDVHITPITDLAAHRAESDASGLDATTIAQANDVVRQAFGLPNDITTVRPVDLTDPQAVADADSNSQQIAVLSAGILEAVQQTDDVINGSTSLEDAIDMFADTFATQGGLVLNDTAENEDTVVSLDDILDGASAVVQQVEMDADTAGVDAGLAAIATSIELSIMGLPLESSDEPDTSIEPLDTATANKLDRAKAFVSDLRNISASSQLGISEAAETFGTSLELAFEDQVDTVTGVVTNDLTIVTQAVDLTMDAIVHAHAALEEDETLTSFTADAGELREGSPAITVAISGGGINPLVFTVNQQVSGVAVAIDATADLTHSEQQDGVTTTNEFNGSISVSGEASNSEFSMAINDGSQASVAYHEVETQSLEGPAATITVPSITLDLDATLTALTAANSPTFNGSLVFAVTAAMITRNGTDESVVEGVTTSTRVGSLTFEAAEIALTGTFSNTLGGSVEATLSLVLDNAAGFVLRIEEIFQWDSVLGTSTYTETQNEETASDFIDALLTVGLIASLPGIDDTIELTLTVERIGVEDGSAELSLMFGGKTVTASGNSLNEVINIANQDGVAAVLNEDLTGHLGGTVSVDGEQVATVEEDDDGIVVIRYNDGTFETVG